MLLIQCHAHNDNPQELNEDIKMPKFWETTPLEDMSDAQWESLCDGCGRCCLQKLEDEDTREVHFTRVSCKLLDTESCRCINYAERFQEVPHCLSLRPLSAEKIAWLPESCAYAKLSCGKSLEAWQQPFVVKNLFPVAVASVIVYAFVGKGSVDSRAHSLRT